MHNILRSEDMMLGGPFDVLGFALLQCMIAQKLGVRPGIYTHSISNAHVYDNHYEGAKEIINRTNDHKKVELHLPVDSFIRAEQKDENLVGEILADLQAQYNPLPPIGGLEITL
jgi:thymidylate synthase